MKYQTIHPKWNKKATDKFASINQHKNEGLKNANNLNFQINFLDFEKSVTTEQLSF